jgi:hypothetical protein
MASIDKDIPITTGYTGGCIICELTIIIVTIP